MTGRATSTVARFAATPRAGGDATALGGVWFEAASRAGKLRLYTGGTARHAADAALALYGCEELICALDEWLGAALDWRWIAAPTTVTALASHARVHWRRDGFAGGEASGKRPVCRLEVPWALVRTLPAPGEALAGRLRWPDVPALLTVSQLRIPAEELALLEPGGAVLLPESMSPVWSGSLRTLDAPVDAGLPVVLRSPTSVCRVAAVGAPAVAAQATAAAGARTDVACEVRLALAGAVPGDRLAPWFEGELSEAGPRAGLWRCAAGREPARCLATGELFPWGDGWALALSNIHDVSAPR